MNKRVCLLVFLCLMFSRGYAQNKFEVFFDFGQEYPNPQNESLLLKWILKNPKAQVFKISGYCDSVDVSDFNKELSTKRINYVLDVLKANAIAIKKNISIDSNGKNFKQSKIQAENRKVAFEYDVVLNVNTNKPKNLTPPGTSLFGGQPAQKVIEKTVATKFQNKQIGDIIRLLKINFYLNSDEVLPDAYDEINELYEVLIENPTLKIEIQGHICCNFIENGYELSRFRASFIVDYLVSLGIAANRLSYTGFGNSKPIFPIPEKNEQERIENRRVEILITDL